MRDQAGCIYEWNAGRSSRDSLLHMIFPCAARIQAELGECGCDILVKLPPKIRWFAFHINLTDSRRVPRQRSDFCAALQGRGIDVINGHVPNISKREVQRVCRAAGLPTTAAPRDGDPEELVIVKTDRNFGGENEARLREHDRVQLGLADGHRRKCHHLNYWIGKRRDASPAAWASEEWVVERYVRNRYNFFFRAYVLRKQFILSRVIDDSLIQKMPSGITRQNWFFRLPGFELCSGAENAEIRAVAHAVGRFVAEVQLDFGALDAVQDDCGSSYVIDLNTTPYWGGEDHPFMLDFLTSGLA